MFTVAGNPVLSTPNSDRLDAALGELDFMVSIDIYLNETTRHADIILPTTTALERTNYDMVFHGLSVRNHAKWSPAVLEAPKGVRDLFAPRFYFGCEADDPMVAWAFADHLNPLGAKLRPMFSSDIGHWDVPSMEGVLAEAFELVDDGHLDADAFRTFTFENAVRFYASLDTGFFDGTRVEAEAAKLLATGDGS